MARKDPQFNVRMPAELKDRIDDAAKRNKRSINAEIIHRLQRSLDDDAEFSDSDGVVHLDSLNAKPMDPAQSYTLFSDKDLAELARALLREARERETKAAGKEEEK